MKESALACLILAGTFISCKKDSEFKEYYGGSGIWEIENLEISYFADSTASSTDSVKNFPGCGMFILYNTDIGANRTAYLGQLGIRTYTTVNSSFAWYFENGQLVLTSSTENKPFRKFELSGSGDSRIWIWKGPNNGLQASRADYRMERYSLKRIQTK